MPARIPTEELIADLQNTAADHGEPLTYKEYEQYGSYSADTVVQRFGGWNDGLREAGLEVGKVRTTPIYVLNDIRRVADGERGISKTEYQSVGSVSKHPAKNHFDRWWKATVSAGLSPIKRCPLTPKQFDQYYRAVKHLSPENSLPVLLSMFSGMSPRTTLKLSPDWVRDSRDKNILRVPDKITEGEPWLVRLPETWHNPYTGDRTQTTLPETLEWVLNSYGEIPHTDIETIQHRCFEVAMSANIQSRKKESHRRFGEVPLVRPADLSYTHGTNLVRQGVDTEVIERRLGADGYRGRFHVDDVMLWVYVHDGYEHPEFDPPPVVLDPDTGEPRNS